MLHNGDNNSGFFDMSRDALVRPNHFRWDSPNGFFKKIIARRLGSEPLPLDRLRLNYDSERGRAVRRSACRQDAHNNDNDRDANERRNSIQQEENGN